MCAQASDPRRNIRLAILNSKCIEGAASWASTLVFWSLLPRRNKIGHTRFTWDKWYQTKTLHPDWDPLMQWSVLYRQSLASSFRFFRLLLFFPLFSGNLLQVAISNIWQPKGLVTISVLISGIEPALSQTVPQQVVMPPATYWAMQSFLPLHLHSHDWCTSGCDISIASTIVP